MQTKKLEDEKENSDHKEIEEALHRIEGALKEGKKFTFMSIFGGFLITMGFGVVSISISDDFIASVSGALMLFVGSVILSVGFIKYNKL